MSMSNHRRLGVLYGSCHTPLHRPRVCFLLSLLLTLFPHTARTQDDDFVWFRCDACSATFFQINRTLTARFGERRMRSPGTLQTYDFIEALEDICENTFTKKDFGVKQFEGRKYLFGPGVPDHIPGKGFGQMGMGDYDKRLAAYCRMFVEDIGGEEELMKVYLRAGQINKTALCRHECSSEASGTGSTFKVQSIFDNDDDDNDDCHHHHHHHHLELPKDTRSPASSRTSEAENPDTGRAGGA